MIANETKRSIKSLKSSLIPKYRRILNKPVNNNNKLDFISLNYTNVIDNVIYNALNYVDDQGSSVSTRFIGDFVIGDIVHAHGFRESGLVLGADNSTQFKEYGVNLSDTDEITLTKKAFISNFDDSEDKKAEGILFDTDVLCIFGASLSDSDLTWKDRIIDWFVTGEDRHIIKIFKAEEVIMPSDEAEWMRRELELRERFANSLGIPFNEDTKNRIHVPFGINAFNYKPITDKINSNDPKTELIEKIINEKK